MVYEMGENYQKHKCLQSKLEASFNRPFYPIHWIERACSGIVIMATSPVIASELSKVWLSNVTLNYQVLVKGNIQEAGVFRFSLKDRNFFNQPAITHYKPIGCYGPTTLMEVSTDTECRHQIRRHFSRRCANVIGDSRYGQGKWNAFFKSAYGLNRIFMHLAYVKLDLRNYKKALEIQCPMPDELKSILKQIAMSSSLCNQLGLPRAYSFRSDMMPFL